MRVESTMTYGLIEASLSEKALEAISFGSDDCNRLVGALDNAYVNKSAISVPFWADGLGVEYIELFSFVCADILDIDIRNKYASLTINNRKALVHLGGIAKAIEYRRNAKLAKYMPRLVEEVQPANLTKVHSGVRDTGLVRNGFAKSANVQYRYDIAMLEKYYDAILANTIKSMTKIAKKYNRVLEDSSGYAEISELVLETIIADPYATFNLEANINDSRGRAIYTGLKRVFNPVGYKDARALINLVNMQTIAADDREAIDNIYSFIAELLGMKRQRYATKILAGMVAYKRRELPTLDLDTEEGRKELHERIWLERIYAQLDELFDNGVVKWSVPIELDASMSLAQVIGCLTGDERLLNKTNVVEKDDLQDPWHIDGVRRLSAKSVGTPTFYGSSATATSLLKSKGVDIRKDELKAIRREFNSGAFAVIKALKDALIKTSNVDTPTYTVQGWGEEYEVEVNKFHAVASELKPYMVWNPKKNRTKTFFMHHPVRVPDYKRFQLFMATGLVHNLDSKIADTVVTTTDSNVIAIHDAFLVLPGSASTVRHSYVNQLTRLYNDRHTVLSNYRKSIGAVGPKADKAFAKVVELTEEIDEFEAKVSALK